MKRTKRIEVERTIEERVADLECVNESAGKLARIGLFIGAAIGFFGANQLIKRYKIDEEEVCGRISELEMDLKKLRAKLDGKDIPDIEPDDVEDMGDIEDII